MFEISNEDFEKRVPDSLKTEFKKLTQKFEFPKQETQNCNPKDLHSILNYINNLHTHLKQDAELWLEMIGRCLLYTSIFATLSKASPTASS